MEINGLNYLPGRLAVSVPRRLSHLLRLATSLRRMLYCETSRNASGVALIAVSAGLNRHERVAIATRSLSAGLADQNLHSHTETGLIAQMLEARATTRPCLLSAGIAACAATLLLVLCVKHSCRFPDHYLGMGNDLRNGRNRLLIKKGRLLMGSELLMGTHLLMRWNRLLINRSWMLLRSNMLMRKSWLFMERGWLLLISHLVVRSRMLVRRIRLLDLVVKSSLLMMSHLRQMELVNRKHLGICFLALRAHRNALVGLGLL
ncbi:hypothetical protein B0T13DRAFT_485430 [Neurospora crassa]|nr:hypothetical protein B0T13DRAFT_485430 [Neurospora crassa]